MGIFDKVSSAASSVGESISSGVAGVEDVVVGAVEGDQDRVEQGLSDVGTGLLTAATMGQSDLLISALDGAGDLLGGLFDTPDDSKIKQTAEDLQAKQQELADVQRDEAIRNQQEQAAVAKRNIFRQRIAEDVQTQAAQAAATARSGLQGSVTSVSAQAAGSLQQQAARTAFGSQFGLSEVERQLQANIGFIETTAGLGQEISVLSQSLAEQQQKQAQQANAQGGFLQGILSGAGAGAVFGPTGAIVGGVLGGVAGGAGSGLFKF